MSVRSTGPRSQGFTLIEVLVALIVISIGLLGVAKMQVVALAESAIAAKRSLAAVEAASLASSMHANRAYWAAGLAPASFTVSGAKISDANLSQTANCASGTSCTALALAAYDTQQWVGALNALLPGPTALVSCSQTAGSPVSCIIQINWAEQQVVLNPQGASGPTLLSPTYTLYVEP